LTIEEFSGQFDLQFNNITSNQAPGLNEHEKSVFATKAEKEVVKNYFSSNSAGNTLKEGFDDSAKRQADFSMLLKTSRCTEPFLFSCSFDGETIVVNAGNMVLKDSNNRTVPWNVMNNDTEYTVDTIGADNDPAVTIGSDTYIIEGYPFDLGEEDSGTITKSIDESMHKIDPRSGIYTFPNDVFIVINESIQTTKNRNLQVIPLRYDEYTRLMTKPYKRPLKYQAWRLMNSGLVEDDEIIEDDELVPNPNAGIAHKRVEIITNSWDTVGTYSIRYIRTPDPIILADLDVDGLSIDGQNKKSKKINIDPILHEDILQRAVELAKIAWTATGQDNAQMVIQSGQRSE